MMNQQFHGIGSKPTSSFKPIALDAKYQFPRLDQKRDMCRAANLSY